MPGTDGMEGSPASGRPAWTAAVKILSLILLS
jgi:hypothetical protein